MPQTHKTSFLVILALLFLLPIFFIPGGSLNLEVAKSALFSFGMSVVVLVFLFEIWQEGKLNLPWHPLILTVVLLPLVYALSAVLSTPSSLSLLGYNFEVGTFGFMLFGSIALVLSIMIFSNTSRILQALGVFFVSISMIILFTSIKIIFGGDILVLGNFVGKAGNPLGNWTDLAISFGLFSTITALVLGMVTMKSSFRIIGYVAFAFGVILSIILNFLITFILTLLASIFLFFYFSKIEKHFFSTASNLSTASNRLFLRPTFLPIILGVISLVFLINPTVSKTQGTLGDVISKVSGVQNIDVRPSLSATLNVSKAVLSQDGLLGSGPNTFGQDWLVYKSIDVNTTPFWATSFPFGVGFIPTQIATTGLLGSVLWIIFFALLVLLMARALSRLPESRNERFILISTLLLTILLWLSCFLYTPSITILILTFIFTGMFLAVCVKTGVVPCRVIVVNHPVQTRFVSIILIALIVLGALFLGWTGANRTISVFYFKKAIDLSNNADTSLVEIEDRLHKAIKFSPLDRYYVALSRLYFTKAQVAASATTGIPTENKAIFEDSLKKSIGSAKYAVDLNPNGYDNWIALGMVYSAIVPPPLSIDGAYENAQLAFSEARLKNPTNPEVPLLFANLEINHGDINAARSFIRRALALKEDYANAYLMLARLEIQAGNTSGAIASAERLAALVPNNPGIYFELGLLKYSNKDYTGAVDAFNQALVLTPDYANAKYYLGLALVQIGRLDEARAQFEALLLTNPDSAEVRSMIEFLNKNSSHL
ncbi:MAG: tetratricopeptide repeat protein [Patescibacteria group bacterium]